MKKTCIYIIISILLTIGVIALEPGDLIRITTQNIEEYSFLKYIDDDGFITLPYIGKIKAKGILPSDLAVIIENKLNDGYFRDPEVIVELEKEKEKKYYIFGLVRKAGEYKLEDGTRVLKAISKAGGYLGNVSDLVVKIFRTDQKVGIFELDKIITQNKVNYNVEIKEGDIICIISEAENGY
ncbi:MAG: hypothetical protein C0601_02465 [Candidatus Muiribacterium halophilum]|uniref:Polysaccharide export protein N-terminal domain-containing protein n=1 Tax=Muiribacterium halophilum TaxID=2053465 RepID=A0A2N5ZKR6_MUIH1|nr:MAG: hypothetical protein C0601_02465 [Candidatus Muirbacterium halophilum]